jgi:hypothetical protein
LAVGWLGIGSLDLNQRIDAGTALRQLIGTHIRPPIDLVRLITPNKKGSVLELVAVT